MKTRKTRNARRHYKLARTLKRRAAAFWTAHCTNSAPARRVHA
jgi:hypothetical protein